MYREIPLPPPSIWDPNSILTAIKTIAYRTGNFDPAPGGTLSPGTLRVYNDPCTALGVGSGVWQIELSQNMEMPGETDGIVTFVIRYQGNASISVGGIRAAPMPALNGYIFSVETGPMFPLPNIVPGQSPGNASILRPQMLCTAQDVAVAAPGTPDFGSPGNYSRNLAQLYATALAAAGPGGTVETPQYWSDPQTAIGTGTGLWCLYISAWTAGSTALTVIGIGGCSLQMHGGPPPTYSPASWNYGYYGYTSSGQPRNGILSATQVPNRFAL